LTFKGYRIPIIVVAAAAAFVVLVTAHAALQRSTVDRPLAESFDSLGCVESFEIADEGEGATLAVRLEDVNDLRQAYLDVREAASKYIDGQCRLEVLDRRSEALEDAFYSVHYAVYEGAETGRYSWMAGEVRRILDGAGVDRYRVRVDDENVYVQLHAGDAYLYEVIPKEAGPSGAASAGGEGETG